MLVVVPSDIMWSCDVREVAEERYFRGNKGWAEEDTCEVLNPRSKERLECLSFCSRADYVCVASVI